MISLEHVSVDIRGRRIIDDVSLSIADGEVVGLLGPNGSGKSTLLKALYGVRRPSAGTVLLDGADLVKMPRRDAAKRLAVLTQDQHVEFETTVAELVMVGRTPHQGAMKVASDQDRAAVLAALERVGCADMAQRSVHSLSGGERQRIYIARALAQGCDHLLLDEPTNHLDIRYQIEVLETVKAAGVTVLAALHELSLAALYCDSVHLLAAGQVRASGTPAQVITPLNVLSVYGAQVLVLEHPEARTPHVLARRARDRAQQAINPMKE